MKDSDIVEKNEATIKMSNYSEWNREFLGNHHANSHQDVNAGKQSEKDDKNGFVRITKNNETGTFHCCTEALTSQESVFISVFRTATKDLVAMCMQSVQPIDLIAKDSNAMTVLHLACTVGIKGKTLKLLNDMTARITEEKGDLTDWTGR